jgi:hypothetical protein
MAARISLSDILVTQHAFETGSRALETGTTQTLNLCVSLLSFFASALICHWRKDTKLLVHYRWFFAAALTFTCTLAGLECAPDWLPLAQATIFAIPVAIGLHQRDRFLRTVGAIGMVCFVMPNLIGRTWSPFAVLPIGPLMFSISALYDKAKDQDLLMDKVWIKSTYRSLALYVLVQLTQQMFSGIPLLIGWSAEALVILWIGLRKDDKFMGIAAASILALVTGKWFAVDLFSAAQFMGFKAAVLSSFLAAGALLAAAFMYKGEADSGRLSAVNSDNAAVTPAQPAAKAWKNWFVGYFLAALSIGVASNWFNADPGIRIFILLAEFAVCLLTGMQLGMANLRAIAALGTFCLGAIFVLGTYSDLNLLTTTMAVLILHSISWLYRKTDSSQLAPFEAGVRSYYDCAGAVLLMVLSSLHAGNWLSVAWVLQGTALISAGFHLKEKTLRWFGLTIFGFVMMHLLFVELAHAQTIYRILSFITAGTLLLAASFAYARFSAAERLAKA